MELTNFIKMQTNKLVNGVYTFDDKVEMLISSGLTRIEMSDTTFMADCCGCAYKQKLYFTKFDLSTRVMFGNFHNNDKYDLIYTEKYSEMHTIRQHTIEMYVNELFVLLMQKVDNEKVASYVNLITETFLNKLQVEKVKTEEKIKEIDASLESVDNSIAELEIQLSQYRKVKEELLNTKEDASFKNVVNKTAERFAVPFDEPNSKIVKYLMVDIMKQTGWFR